ncbi:hypothetical protein OU415_15965 [Saccharopolyspora sp. WRP15-2]|uniref:Uncharacterized protein n=1 Tax=Saccharopolyspora oryzae TaxID=2997343 RepID=A0ABT4V0I0_9PSEU|nr:hypothetical protein [Saccharopolyspora oryzae]MDA3626941.1 hypothetical protein [Saccharopolyspora oryzae]
MNRDQRTAVKVVSVIGALIWVVLGLRYGWPAWLWIGLVGLTIAGPWVVSWWLLGRVGRKDVPAAEVPVEQPALPQPSEQQVSGTPLRSAHPEYRFSFSGAVFWYVKPDAPGLPHANPAGLAVDMVLEQAGQIAAETSPEDGDLAQYRLNAVLGTPRSDPSGHVVAWASAVRLALPDADEERLRQLAAARKDEELWERQRAHERNKRTYFAEDVLQSPGSALVWWLARHEDGDLDEAVRQISNLRKLSAAAHDRQIPDSDAPNWIHPVHSFVVDGFEVGAEQHVFAAIERLATGDERAALGHRLAEALDSHGHRDLAQLVRDRFGDRQELPGSGAAVGE